MNKKNIKDAIETAKYMLSFIFKKKGGKMYFFLKLCIAVIDALVPLIYVILPGLIINELLQGRRIMQIIFYILTLCLMPIFNEVMHYVINKKITMMRLNLDLDLSMDFYSHVADMDLETTESPAIQMLKGRAQETLESSVSIIDSLLGIVSAFIRLISLSTLITTMNPLIIILIIIQIWLNSILSKKQNKSTYDADIKLTSFGRRLYAATCVFDDNDYAKELRLFNIKDFILNIFERTKREENEVMIELRKSQFFTILLSCIVRGIQQCIVYLYLVYEVFANSLPLGNFTIYLSSVDQFSSSLGQFMSTYVDLLGRSYKVDDLVNFMNIPMRQLLSGNKTPCINRDSIIEFRNVSFRYLGSDKYALNDLNLTLNLSEKLCIVGRNGSGKSTFIKLLTRLYFPTEGEIFLDGVNINEYDYRQYQALFSPVFQDFQLFYMSLRQNICLNNQVDEILLKKTYEDSFLNKLIDTLPYSDETQVYKWECSDGFEPSGGEAQRIAIARALYRNGEIFLLDEPTAALDPDAEYEIYTQFHNMINGKCAVFITHRLSAVQLADKVAVFDDGHVAEYGTHEELYAKGGIYTEMFDKQAQFYRDAPAESAEAEE